LQARRHLGGSICRGRLAAWPLRALLLLSALGSGVVRPGLDPDARLPVQPPGYEHRAPGSAARGASPPLASPAAVALGPDESTPRARVADGSPAGDTGASPAEPARPERFRPPPAWKTGLYEHGTRRSGRQRCSNASLDRKSTRLNSSHVKITYTVFTFKKKIHK